MATAYIEEYSGAGGTTGILGQDGMTARQPASANTNVTYTTATQSTAFQATTRLIRLQASKTTVLHFAIGANPTATANSPYIPAGDHEYFGVEGGHKVSCYDGSS